MPGMHEGLARGDTSSLLQDRHPFARIIEIRFNGSSSQPPGGTPCRVLGQTTTVRTAARNAVPSIFDSALQSVAVAAHMENGELLTG